MLPDYSLFPILSKFQELTWRSDDPSMGECFCPAHDDGLKKDKKSLHVTIKPDEISGYPKLMLFCHAGCSSGEIVRSVGEGFAALFADRRLRDRPNVFGENGQHRPPQQPDVNSPSGSQSTGSPSSRQTAPQPAAGQSQRGRRPGSSRHQPNTDEKIVAIYNYHDANGEVLHQTIRYEPKRFSQRRRAEAGKNYIHGKREYRPYRDRQGKWWLNTLHGIEPVPFHLPEILSADPARVIFWVEGEKDAIRLSQLGLLTTTIPMGAGKWRESYKDPFRGRRVVIIPDFDKPRKGQTDPTANAGFDGAKKIAAELIGIAAEVRIAYLPDLDGKLKPKWDLSDWLDAGGTLEQFREAVKSAPILSAGHPGLIPSGNAKGAGADCKADSSDANEESSQASGKASGELAGLQHAPIKDPIRGSITNYYQTAESIEPLTMREILSRLKTAAQGWPKRVENQLFFCDRESDPDAKNYRVDWITKTPSLFGWLGSHLGTNPDFAKVPAAHTKEELFCELQRSAEHFEFVDQYPHFPPIKTAYYACPENEKWVSKRPGCLNELVARFCPETSVDAELIKSMILTFFWGGPGGRRPLFLVTADSGRAAGKSTIVSFLASLCGGTMHAGSSDDDEILRQRLLSPEGMTKRVVFLDNVKSHRFSSASLESLITSERISGKRMYVGEGSRPNLLTYIIAMNGPAFSTDLAQRAITIKIGKPDHSAKLWFQQTAEFIEEHRSSIIAEILQVLSGPKNEFLHNSRWSEWEKEVLGTSQLHQECQDLILSRQSDLDVEQEEAQLIQDQVEGQLERQNLSPERSRIFITNSAMVDWVNQALGERYSKMQVIRIVGQKIDEGRLPRITKSKHPERVGGGAGRKERGFFWTGPRWREELGTERPGELTTFDLDDDFLFR